MYASCMPRLPPLPASRKRCSGSFPGSRTLILVSLARLCTIRFQGSKNQRTSMTERRRASETGDPHLSPTRNPGAKNEGKLNMMFFNIHDFHDFLVSVVFMKIMKILGYSRNHAIPRHSMIPPGYLPWGIHESAPLCGPPWQLRMLKK